MRQKIITVISLLLIFGLWAYIIFPDTFEPKESRVSIEWNFNQHFRSESISTSENIVYKLIPVDIKKDVLEEFIISYNIKEWEELIINKSNIDLTSLEKNWNFEISWNRDYQKSYELNIEVFDSKNTQITKEKKIFHSLPKWDKRINIKHQDYITNNISEISPVETVLWWTWYVTNIEDLGDNKYTIFYEDWHIDQKLKIEIIEDDNWNIDYIKIIE